jgi:RimJ/RimL family protein N-acetyltransferase
VIVSGPHVVEWVAKRTNEFGSYGAAQGIGIERDGVLIGGVVYNEFNGPNCCMHTAATDPRWLTRNSLFVIFDYPFRQMGVDRVTAPVGEGNWHARQFVEKVGFWIETRLTGAHASGDLMLYVMWKKGCRWLHMGRVNDEKPRANLLRAAA